MTSREELKRQAEADGIEFFFAQFVDMHGKPCAKLVPRRLVDLLMDGGAGFAGFAAGPMGQTPKDPDLIAVPDPASYLHGRRGSPSWPCCMCDIHVDGEPWALRPRAILKQPARPGRGARARPSRSAPSPSTSSSPASRTARVEVADPLDTADLALLRRQGPDADVPAPGPRVEVLQRSSGGTNYANDHEDANGQFEQNFKYADALTTADRAIFFRYMVDTLAQERGHGGHVHAQAVRAPDRQRLPHPHRACGGATRNVFEDDPSTTRAGSACRSWRYQFVGGLMDARAGVHRA